MNCPSCEEEMAEAAPGTWVCQNEQCRHTEERG